MLPRRRRLPLEWWKKRRTPRLASFPNWGKVRSRVRAQGAENLLKPTRRSTRARARVWHCVGNFRHSTALHTRTGARREVRSQVRSAECGLSGAPRGRGHNYPRIHGGNSVARQKRIKSGAKVRTSHRFANRRQAACCLINEVLGRVTHCVFCQWF